MEPQYEDTVIEALENSYGEFPDRSGLAACLLETAKVIVEDNLGDYYTELRGVKAGSLLEDLDDLSTETWFKGLGGEQRGLYHADPVRHRSHGLFQRRGFRPCL